MASSSISYNDYINNYTNYDTGYDVSALFSSTSNQSSGNMLADYASIKNGSYGKLMKAYYARQKAQSASETGDSAQKLTLMRSSADSLKKSADVLNNASLWEKKKITKKDEETGEEIEVEDYDWDAITKAVKSFITNYNAVVTQAGDFDNKNILRNAVWMTGTTNTYEKLFERVGISIGKGNKLELDEDALKKADMSTIKSLFTGNGSFADKISQKANTLSNVAASAAVRAKGIPYTSNGSYSDTLSTLYSSTVDEKIGNKNTISKDKKTETKDKNSDSTSKITDKKEDTDEKKKNERTGIKKNK